MKWQILSDNPKYHYEIITEGDAKGEDSEVIATVDKKVDYSQVLEIAAAPEMARALKTVYESFVFPGRHSLLKVRKLVEEAMVKAGMSAYNIK